MSHPSPVESRGVGITPTRDDLAAWYCGQFTPDLSNYATMQPRGRRSKYIRANQPLTLDVLRDALDGRLTVAAVPIAPDGSALAAIIDIDAGGREGVAVALDVCASLGLWAVAQLGQSNQNDGGHVIIPSAAPLPAPLLKALAEAIQARAGVEGECWPTHQDLRLPLQVHLRAPGGPRRFPLLFQTGELLDASDPWQALAELRDGWQPNPPELLTRLAGELTPPSPERPAKLHKSKVNPLSGDTVISWFCSNYELGDVLRTAGADIADRRAGIVTCPFHDDKSPSLAYWTQADRGGKERRVCKCLSRHSSCDLAAKPWHDAFDLFTLIERLTPSEAVKLLVEQHELGQKRTFKATPTEPAHTGQVGPVPTLESHTALIDTLRVALADAIREGATRRGHVTIIKATPGMGKTHTAAEIAEVKHAQGYRVAIIAPTRQHAAEEWASRLTAPHIWQARRDCCTCRPRAEIEELERRGYYVECIKEDCPYRLQDAAIVGRVPIFQYPHLVNDAGRRLADYDLIIIDESPLAALISEHTATLGELRALARRMEQDDPARPLVNALADVADAHGRADDLHGSKLMARLTDRLGDVAQAIKAAQKSPLATLTPVAPTDCDPQKLPRQFLGRLLRALAHDATGKGNALATWGKAGNGWGWVWYQPAPFLARARGRFESHTPAVIVLDGSADSTVCERLYRPWPVSVVEIDAPLSPSVRLVQIPMGPSTRRAVADAGAVDTQARYAALTAIEFGIQYDAVISYKATTPALAEKLEVDQTRTAAFGANRGRNHLQDARAPFIAASPTVPPASIERITRALWYDGEPIATGKDGYWRRRGTGDYQGIDPRLEAVNRLHGPEELRQAIHRARPILAEEPATLVILTPWRLDTLGLAPSLTVSQLPHGNSKNAQCALADYRERVTLSRSQDKPVGGAVVAVGHQLPNYNTHKKYRQKNNSSPAFVIDQLPANWQDVGASPPLPAGLGKDCAPAPFVTPEALDWAIALAEAASEQRVRLHIQGDRVTCDRPHVGIEQGIADAPPGLAEALRQYYRAIVPWIASAAAA